MHGGDIVWAHEVDQPLRQLDRARVRGAPKGVEERQLIKLRDDRITDLFASEAEICAPQAADAVHHAMAVYVPDPAAVAARDDVRGRIPNGARVSHRVQQV